MTANEREFELGFWGDCTNTFVEEQKQYVYARLMHIRREHYSFRVYGRSIIDIGGGPVSMLLKCHDLGDRAVVVDPLLPSVFSHQFHNEEVAAYPHWITERYESKGITWAPIRGEELSPAIGAPFDEAWIYNVLQHTDDPALVVKNALAVCRRLRIFEWVNVPPCEGHPHMLTEVGLNDWLGMSGDVIPLSYEACNGLAYVNVVEGKAR